ncbi:MAG: TonB-dependent receptor plug domain-containing protein [Bacteroidota bacterium]
MRRLFTLALIVFCSIVAMSQTIQVYDKTTGKAIPDVAIVNFSETHSTLTDNKGKASLDNFNKGDSLLFQHTSYQSVLLTTEEIKNYDYRIALFPSVIQLAETVISANRWEQKREEVPMKIEVISPSEIQMMEPQTSADMLSGTGRVFVQKSQLGGGSPMIRGFATNKVLLVYDGIRMNNAIFRHGNLQNVLAIDPNALESSEVIFGPGSVIYGSDAIGGVMDFHAYRPRFSEKDSLLITGKSMVRYNSGNNGKTGHFHVNLGWDKFSSLTSISYADYGNLRMGETGVSDERKQDYLQTSLSDRQNGGDSVVPNYDPYVAKGSGFNQTHLLQKFAYKINDNSRLQYNFYYSTTSDIPRYDRLIQKSDGRLKYAEWYYGPQTWMAHSLKYDTRNKTFLWDDFKVQASYQDYQESRHDRKANSDWLRHRSENVRIASINADAFKALDSRNAIFYGIEGSMSKVFSDAYRENIVDAEEEIIASRYPDNSDYSGAALYASYRHLIGSDIAFTTGARLNAVYAFSPFSGRFYDFPFSTIKMNTISPNAMAGLSWNPQPDLRITANLSTGFRAPNIDDIGKVFDSEPGNVVVPNDDLQPEYAYNADMNISKTFGDIVRLEAGGFYTILSNAMVRENYTFNGRDSIIYDGEMSRVQAIQNIGRVNVYGFNTGVFADLFKNLSLKSVFTIIHGEDQDGNPYRHVPPMYGSTHLMYRAGQISADLYASYNGEISPGMLSPEEHGKNHMYTTDPQYAVAQEQLPPDEQFNPDGLYSPAWVTLNLKIAYALNESLVFTAGVENITDQLYRPYSSGIPAMGRSFILSLRGSF